MSIGTTKAAGVRTAHGCLIVALNEHVGYRPLPPRARFAKVVS